MKNNDVEDGSESGEDNGDEYPSIPYEVADASVADSSMTMTTTGPNEGHTFGVNSRGSGNTIQSPHASNLQPRERTMGVETSSFAPSLSSTSRTNSDPSSCPTLSNGEGAEVSGDNRSYPYSMSTFGTTL